MHKRDQSRRRENEKILKDFRLVWPHKWKWMFTTGLTHTSVSRVLVLLLAFVLLPPERLSTVSLCAGAVGVAGVGVGTGVPEVNSWIGSGRCSGRRLWTILRAVGISVKSISLYIPSYSLLRCWYASNSTFCRFNACKALVSFRSSS